MKQKTFITLLAALLFSGASSACQRGLNTLSKQLPANNLQPLTASLSPNIGEQNTQGKDDNSSSTREYKVDHFDKIDCSTVAHIYFTQGNETRVVAKLRQGDLNFLEVSTHNGCLKLRTTWGKYPKGQYSVGPKNRVYIGELDGSHSAQQEVDLYITAPSLRKLDLSGVCSFTAEHLNVPKLEVESKGVCQIKLPDLKCNETQLDISGVCTIDATIAGEELEVQNSGSGTTNLDFKGTKASFDNSGVGKFTAQVDCKILEASNTGVATMKLKGTADQTEIKNGGMGKISTKGLNCY